MHHPTTVEATLSKALGLKLYPSAPSPQDRESQVQAVRSPCTPPAEAEVSGYQAPPKVPPTLKERLALARDRLRHAAQNGIRIRVYEVALDLDMSEFHFARQFRAAYDCSPHVFYDEIRAAHARKHTCSS